MGLEALFAVDDSEFPLSAVFDQLSSVRIELDRVVPTEIAEVHRPESSVTDSDPDSTDFGNPTNVVIFD